MAGETILIVEDYPETLKFTAGILRREGYRVTIASTAEQALSTLRFLQPDLILVDFMLPGMDGLQLTAAIRQDPRLQRTVIVALTAAAAEEHERRAREAGCDGFLAKPIDAPTLLARIRDFLQFGKSAPAAFSSSAVPLEVSPAPQTIPGLPEEELVELQDSFLKAGKSLSRRLLAELDSEFDPARAGKTIHQWIGSAGLLGFPLIANCARDAETLLRLPSPSPARLRGPLTNLARSFMNPAAGLAENASRDLAGRRIGLIGLNDEAADSLCAALGGAGARPLLFEADQSPSAEAVSICHLAVVQIRPENRLSPWLAADAPLPPVPVFFLASAEDFLALAPKSRSRAPGFLFEGCLPEEMLMRLRLAVTYPPAARAAAPSGGDVVIAYAEPSSRPVIEARLKDQGLKGIWPANGPDAILLLHSSRPAAAVLDVHMDGLEALADMRASALSTRTIFLASEGHDDEIMRAFSLGAEDYLIQPFTPLELVARLRRLID